MTSPPKVTRQELDQTIDELRAIGGVHLLPIMTAVRDYGIAFVQILLALFHSASTDQP